LGAKKVEAAIPDSRLGQYHSSPLKGKARQNGSQQQKAKSREPRAQNATNPSPFAEIQPGQELSEALRRVDPRVAVSPHAQPGGGVAQQRDASAGVLQNPEGAARIPACVGR